jgi:DNA-binding response OmpR family regulator
VPALLRPSQRPAGAAPTLSLLEFGAVRVDFGRYEAKVHGAPVELTRKEYGLLRYLAKREGLAVTREQLLDDVWSHEARLTTRTVDNHVATLRSKLGEEAQALKTIHGVGYKFARAG